MNKIAVFTIFLALAFSEAKPQNGYIATLNGNDASVVQRSHVPGLTSPTFDDLINSAYDQNHKHYIFVGTGSNPNAGGFSLYTVDVLSGAVLDSPVLNLGTSYAYYLNGLQYDNGTDTLYAVYEGPNKQSWFSWIDLSTGTIHLKTLLPGVWTFVQSSFDTKDNLYIMTNSIATLVISASSGVIQYNYNFVGTPILNINFDNLTGKLYGIGYVTGPQTINYFDSITVATGVVHPIAAMPDYTYTVNNTYTIDELGARYLVATTSAIGSACWLDSLVALDINTGSVLSILSAPDAAAVPIGIKEYVINYCYDNQTGTFYGLDSHPPVTIRISAAANNICTGVADTLTALVSGELATGAYQWQINGSPVGSNDSVFTSSSLADGDIVSCVFSLVANCSILDTALSNTVLMQVRPDNPSSVTITASSTMICSDDTVAFTAGATGGGAHPFYQWRVNGNDVGSNNSVFTAIGFANGDSVDCIMTGSVGCSLAAPSNRVGISVRPAPVVQMGNDTVISPGSSIRLDPGISGTVTSYQWTPATGLDNPSIPGPIATPVATTTYRLTVTADDGCMGSGKITIIVYAPLKMPGAFTPNGDGRNDVFRIPASTPQKIKSFSVYNRLGQRVFMTANATMGWDGTLDNRPQPTGTYVWQIEYTDLLSGIARMASGTVLLIR